MSKKLFKSKLFKDSSYVFISDGLSYLTRILWGILLARWLGAEYLGIFYYYVGIFSIVASLGEFGKIGHLMRQLNASENPKNDFIFYVHKHLMTTIILCTISIVYVSSMESKINYLIIGYSSVFIAYFDSFTNVITTWYFSNERAKFVSNTAIARSVLTLLTGFIFYLLNLPNYLLLCVPAFYSLLRFSFFSIQLLKNYQFYIKDFILQRVDLLALKIILKDTWVFGLLSLLSTIQGQSDPAILKALGFTPRDFGIIGAASKMKSILMMAGGAILNVIFPRLTKDFTSSREKLSITFYKIIAPLITLNMLFCSFLILFSETIIKLLYGSDFIEAIPFMILFSAGSIVPLAVFLSSSVIAIGQQKMVLVNSLIVNLSYPLLKLIFIPMYGSISIGWIEAILPYIIVANFFYFLRNAIIPKLDFIFYLKFIFLIIISIGLPVFVLIFGINIYSSFIFIGILIIIVSYKFGFVNKSHIPFLIRNN